MKKILDYITGSTQEDRKMMAASAIFQIQEHDGGLWITYQGNLVCPCDMMKDEPVQALQIMRRLYVERN